jgi:hypothetical protein
MNYRFSEDAAITVVDFDPNQSDTLTDGGMTGVDMEGYHRLTALYFPTVASGTVQDFALYGDDTTTGANATQIVTNGSKTVTALTGYLILETSADEIAAVDDTIKFITARLSLSTGTDEGRLVIIRHGARDKQTGLSADSV